MASIKCKSCGADIKPDLKFCGACGTPVEREETAVTPPVAAAVQPAPVKKGFDFKKLNLKKYIKPAIAAVVLLVVIIAAAVIFTPSKYDKLKGSIIIENMDDSVIIIQNGKKPLEMDGYANSVRINMDETKAAFLLSDGYSSSSDGYELYLLSGGKTQKIDSDVFNFTMSAGGGSIAYIKDADDGVGELWLYAGGKKTRVAEDVLYNTYNSNASYVLSPNGKALGYVVYSNEKYTGFVWDGKEHELGRDNAPFAVSNGAKYIYYEKNGTYYVQRGYNGDNREKLGDSINYVYMNEDLSQIIYNSDSKAYISVKGKPRESLSGRLYYPMRPNGTSVFYDSLSVCGISDFANTFYMSYDDAVIYINGKYEANSVVKNVDSAYLADDGKTLTYLKNGKVYSVNGKKTNAEAVQLVDRDVYSLYAADNGKSFYFINDDDEIYYQKGRGKPVTVTKDFTWDGVGLFNGNMLVFISDDTLYVSTGDRAKTVGGFKGDAAYLSVEYKVVYAGFDDSGDRYLYRSANAKKFELIYQE